MRVYESAAVSNPYVGTLTNGIKKLDPTLEFIYGLQSFWNDAVYTCNIVHIHWPEKLLLNGRYSSEQLKERLVSLKSHGISIVSTAHNLGPHVDKNYERTNAYHVVYEASAVIFHLGEYSLSALSSRYPDARHELIIHHVYDQVYKLVTRDDALSYFGLDPKYKYLLCFGTIRNKAERKMLIRVHKECRKRGIKVVAPGVAVILPPGIKIYRFVHSCLRYLWYCIRYPDMIFCRKRVPESEIPYYYALANVCFIPRVSILNSGTLPMALLFGRIVVGPDSGNVGPQLRFLKNPVFNPDDSRSVMNAVLDAFAMPESKGEDNKKWAMENMLTSMVAGQVLRCYRNCSR